MAAAINLVFDSYPGSEDGDFLGAHTDSGVPVDLGAWSEEDDGTWVLRITVADIENAW